jgi:hypothetical protein
MKKYNLHFNKFLFFKQKKIKNNIVFKKNNINDSIKLYILILSNNYFNILMVDCIKNIYYNLKIKNFFYIFEFY